LRRKQILGVQFYRQKPIGNYIADFYAPAAQLVVEIDGAQQFESSQAEHDKRRTNYLNRMGLRVLRYSDREVLLELDSVAEEIFRTVEERNPLNFPLFKRGKVTKVVAEIEFSGLRVERDPLLFPSLKKRGRGDFKVIAIPIAPAS